jgi:hypothetical protein
MVICFGLYNSSDWIVMTLSPLTFQPPSRLTVDIDIDIDILFTFQESK